VSCFYLWKAFVQCPSLSVRAFLMTSEMTSSPRNDVAVFWETISNVLVHWSVRMIRAKNYETVSKFVKVMTKILWPLFFTDTVYLAIKLHPRWESWRDGLALLNPLLNFLPPRGSIKPPSPIFWPQVVFTIKMHKILHYVLENYATPWCCFRSVCTCICPRPN